MQALEFSPDVWDLTDVIPNTGKKELRDWKASIESRAARFEGMRGELSEFDRRSLEKALGQYEAIIGDLQRMTCHAYMKYSVDTKDGESKAWLDNAEDTRAAIENRMVFFRLWWTGLDDKRAGELVPENSDFRYFLRSWRKLKPYTLEEKVEQAINLKNTTGISGWGHHYDKVVSNFTFVVKVRGKPIRGRKGKPKEMVVEEVTKLFTSPDGDIREAAYKAILSKYGENGELLGDVYRTIVRDWRNEYLQLRKHASPISPRNVENDVEGEAVEALLASVRANSVVFQRFFELKAKLLGLKKLRRYHIYAPLASKVKSVHYDDAVTEVIEAYKGFDPKVASLALNVFKRRHVDSTPRKGKRNGAYCMSVTPDVVPYIFLNFAGTTRDVYTMAHESGHAVHSQLAAAHSVLTFHPPLVLAETASVFGEMILFDRFMREEKDPEVKKAVLLERISSTYATIARQGFFVVFEKEAHRAIAEGATVEVLSSEYLGTLREQFGSAVPVPEEFRWEWTYIPHIFHTPFYCYAYAFGNLLSLALYERYREEGRSFVPSYLKLLSYGGSESPKKILSGIGVDIEKRRFWDSGFRVIERMVSDLKAL